MNNVIEVAEQRIAEQEATIAALRERIEEQTQSIRELIDEAKPYAKTILDQEQEITSLREQLARMPVVDSIELRHKKIEEIAAYLKSIDYSLKRLPKYPDHYRAVAEWVLQTIHDVERGMVFAPTNIDPPEEPKG